MPLDELGQRIHEAQLLAQGIEPADIDVECQHDLLVLMCRFYPDAPSLRQKAGRINRDLERYGLVRWKHDCKRPGNYRPGGRSHTMFRLLTATGGRVPSAERIRKILASRKSAFKREKSGSNFFHS